MGILYFLHVDDGRRTADAIHFMFQPTVIVGHRIETKAGDFFLVAGHLLGIIRWRNVGIARFLPR